MNDLLYFNAAALSLEDVALAGSQNGYKAEYVQLEGRKSYLDAYHGGIISWGNTESPELRQDRWIFDCTNLDDYDLEEDRSMVEAYCPIIFMSIQYRVAYLCDLTKFLRKIIDKHGGWVYGADDKVHDAATIEQMQFITGDGKVYIDCSSA